jgi:hypothetical protein
MYIRRRTSRDYIPDTLVDLLALVTALGSGLVAGFFFSFSVVVMQSLGKIPAPAGIAAMQSINIVVINPWFFAAFFGTAALGIAAMVGLPLDVDLLESRAHDCAARIRSAVHLGAPAARVTAGKAPPRYFASFCFLRACFMWRERSMPASCLTFAASIAAASASSPQRLSCTGSSTISAGTW